MTKILVLYYSSYGHVEAMARAVAELEPVAACELFDDLIEVLVQFFFPDIRRRQGLRNGGHDQARA